MITKSALWRTFLFGVDGVVDPMVKLKFNKDMTPLGSKTT